VGAKVNVLPNGLVGKFVANCLPRLESFSAKTLYAPVIFAVIHVLVFFTEQKQTAVRQSVCNSAVLIALYNFLTTPGDRYSQPTVTVYRDPFSELKWPGSEADRIYSFDVEVKNERSCNSTPSLQGFVPWTGTNLSLLMCDQPKEHNAAVCSTTDQLHSATRPTSIPLALFLRRGINSKWRHI
jgi:hypothetical protein